MSTRKSPLRAVPEGEVQPPTRVLNVSEAAESGSHRELLAAMRTRIARTVQDPNCPPRDLAALSRRLQEIAKEIESVDARAKKEANERDATPDESFDEEAI